MLGKQHNLPKTVVHIPVTVVLKIKRKNPETHDVKRNAALEHNE